MVRKKFDTQKGGLEEGIQHTVETSASDTQESVQSNDPPLDIPLSETYPCYVLMKEGEHGELIELPTQGDGSLLLSTVTAHFGEDVIGLRYISESGALRGVRVTGDVINPPVEGWGKIEYLVVGDNKRKLCGADDPECKRRRKTQDMLGDLVVLGLPYTITEDELRNYFSAYGELTHCEIKVDHVTKKSKGFGFIRYKKVEAVEAAIGAVHVFNGRNCEVRFPKKVQPVKEAIPTKLFVGKLPQETTKEDLEECFAEFGPLKEVFLPNKFRGYGFVTFPSQEIAAEVMKGSFVMKGVYLNVAYPLSKGDSNSQQQLPVRVHSVQKTLSRGETQHGAQQQQTRGPQQGQKAILSTLQGAQEQHKSIMATPHLPFGFSYMHRMSVSPRDGGGFAAPFGYMGRFRNNSHSSGFPWMPGFLPSGGRMRGSNIR